MVDFKFDALYRYRAFGWFSKNVIWKFVLVDGAGCVNPT